MTDEQYMRACEARDWIGRIRAEGHSRASGQQRLAGILAGVERARGREGMLALKAAIEAELARERGTA